MTTPKIYVIAEDHWDRNAINKQQVKLAMYGVEYLYHELVNADYGMFKGRLLSFSRQQVIDMLDDPNKQYIGNDNLIDPRFNQDIFELVKEAPTLKRLCGFDLLFSDPTYQKNPGIHPQQLRENRMLEILTTSVIPHAEKGAICCIACGRDHLRTTSPKQMGGKSPLRAYIDQNKRLFKFI